MKNTELPKNSKIIFKGVVGSQSYGLATETSDIDIKGVFIQDVTDILSNKYIPQIDVDKDTVYYELRRFLELLLTGNPNVLELLYLPLHCIQFETPEWRTIRKNRKQFLSKKCYNTFSGYARTQLDKASGLNKKFNWEKERTERKTPVHFCKFVERDSGKNFNFSAWLKEYKLIQKTIGLVALDGFRDGYKVYLDKMGKYRGVYYKDSNEVLTSVIPKDQINNWLGILYFNREAYSTHCKEYKEYQKWLKERNPNRTATNKAHGQDYDGKNIMHTVRLILTAREIATQHTINVDRSPEREMLLKIKYGNVHLKEVLEAWRVEADKLKEYFDNSGLPENVDKELIQKLELNIREGKLSYGKKEICG